MQGQDDGQRQGRRFWP